MQIVTMQSSANRKYNLEAWKLSCINMTRPLMILVYNRLSNSASFCEKVEKAKVEIDPLAPFMHVLFVILNMLDIYNFT